jgi:ribosome maturation factor RimP
MAAIDKLNELLGPVVSGMGYEFVGIEYKTGKGPALLRVYIDHENGITVDDCADVSYQVSATLDVEDPISGEYNLELSSPGMDRPLFTASHYQQFVGERIKCKLRRTTSGRRNFTGKILAADDKSIRLAFDNQEVELMIDNIEKANLIPDFNRK